MVGDQSKTRQSKARPLAERPVLLGVEAYTSPDYARTEAGALWNRIWQIACREEEIPNIGDYVVYAIHDESIIVARAAEDQILAYHNVCQHRGRRLVDEGCGHAARLVCRFHGWSWNLEGEIVQAFCEDEWEGTLNKDNLRLPPVSVRRWGGWVFINLDPNPEPFEHFLGVLPDMLDPYELGEMRYRWRQWLYFDCNWKVAIEAFVEGFHVKGTHPQLTKYNQKLTWSAVHGKHSHFGPRIDSKSFGGSTASAGGAEDMRYALADVLEQLWEEVNATTTETIVNAARRLHEELPESTPPAQVQAHLMMRAMQDDAARGVIWPKIPPEHFAKAGTVWHFFPNTVVIPGPTFALCYRARPHGYDPDRCIFEVYVIERFPPGEEPKPDNVHVPLENEAAWRKVLCQDFSNMSAVQRGMKSSGFRGPRPNPVQERGVTNFHRVLADYMGRGAPKPLD